MFPVLLLVAVKLSTGVGRRGPHHPRGETPVEARHHHYRPHGAGLPLTGDSRLLHDTRHLQEDTKVYTKEQLDDMTPDELEFFYFNTHDFDHNNKLDGLELLKAVYHTMEHQEQDSDENAIEDGHSDIETYIALVDRTLQSDDTDGDGFVSYAEYRESRAKRPHKTDDKSHDKSDNISEEEALSHDHAMPHSHAHDMPHVDRVK